MGVQETITLCKRWLC